MGRAGTHYEDRWVTCTDGELVVRGYYFPTSRQKVIPYSAIRSVRPMEIGPWTGKWRLWGTTSPRYWAHLDPGRPHKDTALVLDVGARVKPVITPDDPEAVLTILESKLS